MPIESNAMPVLPSPWAEFLDELDNLLHHSVEVHCIGGFVLAVLHGRPIPTGDIDYITTVPSEAMATIQKLAGLDSRLARKHKVYIQHAGGVTDFAEDYAQRLQEMFPGRFKKLKLLALEVHDIVLSKLTRNSPKDDADVAFLADKGLLDAEVLKERYAKELRPYLSNEDRHDTTLQLWIESYLESR